MPGLCTKKEGSIPKNSTLHICPHLAHTLITTKKGGIAMCKPTVSKALVLTFVVATVVGACLHFLFDFFPNGLTALLSPVNESLWEHLKLIYWPYLAAMFLLTRKAKGGCRGGWLLSLLLISVAMLVVGYVFHIVLEQDSMAFDIGLYVVLMALGFWLPGRLSEHACKPPLRSALPFLTVVLGCMLVLFTFLPPDHILFADLSAVNTWYTIPY